MRAACMLLSLSLAGCSAAVPVEPDADRAATLAAARGQVAHYRYEPPPSLSDRCFDLKVIVRTFRTAREPAEQAKWQKEMAAVCTKAGKTTDL